VRRARSTLPIGSILAWEETSGLRSSSLRRVLSNLRVIPPAAEGGAVYDTIFGVLTPAAIFLVLLERHDHARQPGSSHHHHHPGRKRPRSRRRWLRDIAIEMEIEDGRIWVYRVSEDGVQAFTDFGIENLIESGSTKKTPSGSRAGNGNDPTSLRPMPDAYSEAYIAEVYEYAP
jgi:hypothetical protein